MLAAAAGDVAGIGSSLRVAHGAAAASTTGVLAAAEDEVSAAIAAVFSAHGQGFQALGAQAAVFHDQFVQTLTASAGRYAATEAANAALLQPLNAIVGSVAGVKPAIGLNPNPLVQWIVFSINAAYFQIWEILSPYPILFDIFHFLATPFIIIAGILNSI
jgi:hypothetical protein